MAEDVPLLIPEVNPDHVALLTRQRATTRLGGRAGDQPELLDHPDCAGAEAAGRCLWRATMQVTTMQAISGAGYPGVASYDILDNVIPYIGQEEEKVERETRKLLGAFTTRPSRPPPITISAQCKRVAVREGHMACISVELGATMSRRCRPHRRLAWLQRRAAERALPTAPQPAIIVRDEADRPQPLRDVDAGNGMADGRWARAALRHPRPQVRRAGPQHHPWRGGGLDPQRRAVGRARGSGVARTATQTPTLGCTMFPDEIPMEGGEPMGVLGTHIDPGATSSARIAPRWRNW